MPVLQVRLDDKDHERMRKLAEANNLSASEMVRRWINFSSDAPPVVTTSDGDDVKNLRDEVTRLKQALAAQTNPTPHKLEIREPKLYDSNPDGPFTRFGTSRAVPKPSSKR